MPYEPYSPTQKQREGHFVLVWLGAFISVMMLILMALGVSVKVEGFLALLAGTYMITFTVWHRYDDYFKDCAIQGARWTAVVVGIWLVIRALVSIFAMSRDFGAMVAGGEVEDISAATLLPFMDSAMLLAALCALAFHAGFLFTQFRGRS
ncbi:hypothetical protein [Aurantiacibacter sp. MUD61]|uniref:hypothetical protein n=1 Tax=Aurantiacibacter sp. MUD61 TaxID=3009083 RepID=UPI0022F13941|nr:hypothetical protein [Aurantiacibacter sp. MUD61]